MLSISLLLIKLLLFSVVDDEVDMERFLNKVLKKTS